MSLRPTRGVFAGALAIAVVVGTEGIAHASDVDDLAGLLDESVVSTASRTAEVAHDAPATTSVLTSDDFRRYGIRSLDEAIDFLAMGMMTSNALPGVDVAGRGVMITADYGDHVLVLIDGHVVNEAWASASYLNQGLGVPLELVDHVEIVLGPGSVLYGGSAMLGVVNVVTKRAADFSGAHVVVEGSLSPAQSAHGFTSFAPNQLGNSYRLSAGAGQEFTLFGRRVELTAQLERYQLDGPTLEFARENVTNADGTPKNYGSHTPLGVWGGQVHDQYGITVTDAYTRVVIGDLALSLRAAAYDRKTPYINDFSQPVSNFDDGRNGELDRWLSFDARYTKQLSPKLAIQAQGTADAYDYHQQIYSDDVNDCAAGGTGACRYSSTGVARWLGTDIHGTYDWNLDDRLTTMIGGMVQGRFVGSKSEYFDVPTQRDLETVGHRSAFEVPFAFYGQQRWSPTRWAHFNAGIRFDDAPRGGTHFSPRAAAAFDVWKGGTAKAIYSDGFRAPTFFEAYYQANGWMAAPNLRPETEKSVEGSFEQRLGTHRVLFGVFRTWWDDMVSLQQLANGDLQFQNVARIDNLGYNARVDGTVGSLRYGLSATGAYTRRTTPDGKTPLPVAPQLFGNARVAYELPGHLPTVSLATSLVGPRLADRALDGGFVPTPVAPALVRFHFTVSGAVPPIPGLTYRVGVDAATATRSPYVAGPIQHADPTDPTTSTAQLAPINRLTVFSGLQYDFGK